MGNALMLIQLLTIFGCKAHTKIETPTVPVQSIGTISSRTSILYAYQKLLNQQFEESFLFFQLAHQADPFRAEIISLWTESLCEYPIEKQDESWTKLKKSLKDEYPPPSCLGK